MIYFDTIFLVPLLLPEATSDAIAAIIGERGLGDHDDQPSDSLDVDLRGLCYEDAMEHPRIERDPAIMVGKPVIRGTRVTVEVILRQVAAGLTFGEIAEAYPRVSLEDVQAALTYAADYMAHEGLVSA